MSKLVDSKLSDRDLDCVLLYIKYNLNIELTPDQEDAFYKRFIGSKAELKEYRAQISFRENRVKHNANCVCECGGKYLLKNKKVHNMSDKHQKFLNPPIEVEEVPIEVVETPTQ